MVAGAKLSSSTGWHAWDARLGKKELEFSISAPLYSYLKKRNIPTFQKVFHSQCWSINKMKRAKHHLKEFIQLWLFVQVEVLFLQWIPWILCMSRPGDQITFKSLLMTQKLKEMDKKEIFSKSLLANILDLDDNFCSSKFTDNNSANPQLPNGCFNR